MIRNATGMKIILPLTVEVPIANDVTLENGFVVLLAETDGTYEKIGPGSRRSGSEYDIVNYPSGLLGAINCRLDTNCFIRSWNNKTITVNGKSESNGMTDLEQMTGFSDGDVINFKAYLMDRAGNRIEGSVSRNSFNS